MRRNKKPSKKQSRQNKYYPDVISYYASQKNQNYYDSLVSAASSEDIHKIAIQVFNKTYYISFEDISNR